MPKPRIYLDHNASSPLRPEARAAMFAALDTLGNPSSVHAEGRAARALLENARAKIGAGIGTAAKNVVFTSGATEAANLALTPSLQTAPDSAPFDVLLLGAGEHMAVLAGHRFPADKTEKIPLTPEGELSIEALDAALARHAGKRVMLACQAANNETGVIQPVAEAAEKIHAAGGVLVCDATQAVGRIETSFSRMGADLLFFSSHKLGGPMGAGALAFACDDLHIRETLIRGGGQEGGRRGGTENIAAAAGFAAAFLAATTEREAEGVRLAILRNDVERAVLEVAPDAHILGRGARRLANVCAFIVPGVAAQTLLMALDLEGVAVSSGSACSSGKARASQVLEAMGLAEKEALRVSLGWSSGPEDVKQFGTVLAQVVRRIRSRRPAA